jgi:hypothetical protein
MTEQDKHEAAKEAALSDLAKLKQKVSRKVFSRSNTMAGATKKRGPGRPPKVKTGWLAKVVADMPSVTAEVRADKLLQPKRGPGRPRKGATAEVTPKDLVGIAKRKPGRPKGSGKGKPGRPKGSGKRGPGRLKGKPGRAKGSGKVGRPKASGKVSKGFLAGVVAKQVKPLLKVQSKALKAQVKTLKDQIKASVAKEVKKAIKAALQ